MLSILVSVMLGQFEVGDLVDLKPGGTIHKSWVDATERLDGMSGHRFFGEVIHTISVGGELVIRVQCPLYERPYYMLAKWAVPLDEKTIDRYREEHQREQERIRESMKPPTPEMLEAERRNKEMAEAEEKRQAEQKKADAERKKYAARIADLRKFARNEPENEALDLVENYGWDPLDLTADQVNKLSPSQRKSISGIKLRYIKAQRAKK